MARDERIYPDLSDGNFLFHLHRYFWVIPHAIDKIVLDARCGSGYGAELLSIVARSVLAVDYDVEAITENRGKFAYRPNLTFKVEDVAELSLPDESCDLIVSFEVYEHLERSRSEQFVCHLSRICRPGGWVFLSTPNRLVEAPFMRSAGKFYHYHVNSVAPSELKARLKRHFRVVGLFGQRVRAPRIKGILRAMDVFNLRHRLLSYKAKQRAERVFSSRPLLNHPEFADIRIQRSFVRQSGIIVAACRK